MRDFGIQLHCRDAVDFDRNIYFKEVTIEDESGHERDVRLFQHFDAHLYGNDVGDSAYYDPRSQAIVHYKGTRYFLLSGTIGGHAFGLSSFAIGQKDAPGKEGTWRDAEDGELSRNPVAQGSIDSVGMLRASVPASGSTTVTFWLAAGKSYEDVRELDKLVRERTPASFLARTKDYWRLWANKDESIADHVSPELARLYKRSTLVIRTQVDNRGAIIAGNDSDVLRFNRDTYSYLWPRDGALVADALDLAGYGEVTRRFFYLCGELMTREGYLLHKYNPDGSLGSSWHAWSTPDGRLELPIQEDETRPADLGALAALRPRPRHRVRPPALPQARPDGRGLHGDLPRAAHEAARAVVRPVGGAPRDPRIHDRGGLGGPHRGEELRRRVRPARAREALRGGRAGDPRSRADTSVGRGP